MPVMNGGEALVRSLRANGVEVVFGLPGAGQYEAIDAIYRQEGMRYVTTRNEQAISYMADGLRPRERQAGRGHRGRRPRVLQHHGRTGHRFRTVPHPYCWLPETTTACLYPAGPGTTAWVTTAPIRSGRAVRIRPETSPAWSGRPSASSAPRGNGPSSWRSAPTYSGPRRRSSWWKRRRTRPRRAMPGQLAHAARAAHGFETAAALGRRRCVGRRAFGPEDRRAPGQPGRQQP